MTQFYLCGTLSRYFKLSTPWKTETETVSRTAAALRALTHMTRRLLLSKHFVVNIP